MPIGSLVYSNTFWLTFIMNLFSVLHYPYSPVPGPYLPCKAQVMQKKFKWLT
jgi:hypothetical protein